MIKGSIVALITPMNEEGSVDYAGLEKLIKFHLDEQTDGLLVLGTTGESSTLTQSEEEQILQLTVNTSILNDVSEEGLNTIQSPAAIAGASFHAAIRNGKFHGTICPTTPIGSRSTRLIILPSKTEAVPSSVRIKLA